MADETKREDETEVRSGAGNGSQNDDLFIFDEAGNPTKRRDETEADLTGLDSARAADDVTNPNIHMGIERSDPELPEGAALGGVTGAETDTHSSNTDAQAGSEGRDATIGRDPLVVADVTPASLTEENADGSMDPSPAAESLLDEPEMDRATMDMKMPDMDGAAISDGAGAQAAGAAGSSFVEPEVPLSALNQAPEEIELSNTSFDENVPGAVVGSLSTNDTGEHTYEVSDARFEVVDGVLKLKPGLSLNHEAEPSVSLSVTVTDDGGLSFTQDFTLTVGDVNEGPESVDWTPLPFDENVEGASVGIVHVTDPDDGETFTYTVSDNRFEVVEQNGRTELRLKEGESLDAEQGSVPVTVTVTDSGGETATRTVSVSPTDVNEGPSDISLSNASVDENAAGAVVGSLSTTDVDDGDTHTYSVDDARFEVVDGDLKLKDGVSLNHEAESSVAVEVTTTDASGAIYSETFTIAVGDVNEGPSDISLSNASVDENAAGAVVGSLSTTDVDDGDSHTYTVDDARFEVVDGDLKLKDGVSLNHEAESSVAVEVTTTDASGSTYSETFTIAVGDVNEAPSDISLMQTDLVESDFQAVDGYVSRNSISDRGLETDSAVVTISFTTGDDISAAQTLFETGGRGTGLNIAIEDGQIKVFAGSGNNLELSAPIDANTSYNFALELDKGADSLKMLLSDDLSPGAMTEENSLAASQSGWTDRDWDGGNHLGVGRIGGHAQGHIGGDFQGTIDAPGVRVFADHDLESIRMAASGQNGLDENAAGAVVGSLSTTDVDDGDSHTYSVDDARFEVVDGDLKLKDDVSLDHETESSVAVEVTTTDASGATYSETFTIAVGDVNEGPSDISLSNASVDENADGAVVGSLSTTDVDDGDSHTYSVDDARFEVVDGDLKLKDGVSLDHETESSVTVEVTTTDASGATYSETFTIAVGDVNEGPSDINLDNLSVDENAAGAVVGSLSTTDVDDGDTHSYSVDDARFEVVGGDLKLKDGVSLDHETESSVAVEVTTTDASGATYSETFTIAVGDVNEGPSDITLDNLSVDENAAGAVVGSLSTSDVDDGDTHTYTVDDARFEVVDGDLKLKDGVSLDHETESSVAVEVTTTDASGATYSETFTIAVGDVNEDPSDITLDNLSVDENAAGAVVGSLSTTDVDDGDSHTYGVDDARFEVVGGDLKLKDGVSLNHEAESSVAVEVTTTDASGATYSETFTIAVGDVNEGPSDISLDNLSVDENAAGAVVGSLSTSDVDDGDTHSYSVDDARFEVVGGDLKLKDGVSLDYNADPSVDVTVTTTDASGATYSETFIIAVGDVNEGPSDISLDNLSVDENAAGAVVGSLSTTDVDDGDTHSYTVDDARFEVVGGDLKLKDGVSLNHEAESSVAVEVTTTDASGATYSETFTIAVGDVNEGPSDISLDNLSVEENAAGAVVGSLSTTDVDDGDSHTYSVDDARFEVVGGDLKLKDGFSLDHETESSVAVEVTTTDASGATYSETFTIAVGDVNEGPSDISLDNLSVDENAAGAVVGSLSTTDVDDGDTHTYTVDDARFEVVDGDLKLKDGVSLDHETESSVAVEVTTTDASGATYSETFNIAFGDVNEGPSDISLSNASVDENAAGAVVGSLSTTDVDDGDTHTYSVDDARFEVVDGDLKLKDGVSLNHEAESSVAVEVTTTDASGATYSETFTITVGDVNEGPSDISLSNASVDENSAGAVVGSLSTTDVDDGDSHTYTVDDARFEVVDGDLKLKDGISLDHETESSVAVEVTTTDASGATYSETFTIAVGDVNEGPSDISLSNASVDENAAGAVVGSLSTTDVDDGDSHTYTVDDARFEVVGGDLKLKDGVSLNHEAESSVAVEVTTTDSSGATYSETFTITVGDVNEGPSDISLSNASVDENAAGAVVGSLSTTDVDDGDSHTYSVDDARFEVVDGDLKLKDGISLDHETESSVAVEVTTTDSSGATYSETFTIAVGDVNEGPVTLWSEDFSGLSDGVTSDTGSTAWSATDAGSDITGNHSVQDGAYEFGRVTNEKDDNTSKVVWSSETIDISGQSELDLSFRLSETGSMEENGSWQDTFKAFAVIDGVRTELMTQNGDSGIQDAYNFQDIGTGSTLVIEFEAKTTDGSETFSVDDISVVANGSQTPLYDISDPGDAMPTLSGATYTTDDDYDGSSGDDVIVYNGSDRDNKLDGEEGNDIIVDDNTKGELKGDDGNDTLYGRGGDDKLKGEDGDDTLYGGSGDDKLEGKDGDDILVGGTGDDELKGGKGEDVLFGGAGDDEMKGEYGSDLFIFESGNGDTDYADGGSGSSWTDTIQLQGNGGGAVTMDWTLELDDGSIESSDMSSYDLSEDASGTITFADGSEISFDNIERIEW